MNSAPTFQEARSRLIACCGELINRGVDDPVAYEIYARIWMQQWLAELCQVAERMAERSNLERGCKASPSEAFEEMRGTALRQIDEAVLAGRADLVARAATFLLGVDLAIG